MNKGLNLKQAALGIEMGSTRIKAVLTSFDGEVLATGAHDWENKFENGYWTYPLESVWAGIQDSYNKLAKNVFEKYNEKLSEVAAMGFSGMMHGYLAFDKNDRLLVPFRTWRNTTTEKAAEELTEAFGFNVPQRWSIAHLYQAILNCEAHTKEIAYITTLAGYVHYKLTGEKVMGIGEASGMFPIDSTVNNYNKKMLDIFNKKALEKGFTQNISDLLPSVKLAGEKAGALSEEGARLLDASGCLKHGIPLCPPEGDAGTGMVATNSVAKRTGNVSAGTSVFAMIVLEKELSKLYTEIDMVTTPGGAPVAMVHCNTCTSELDAWVKMMYELTQSAGAAISKPQLYDMLYQKAFEADPDCGGLIAFNYYSGEPITKTDEGRPLFVRKPDSAFNLKNFMRVQLYSTMATLAIGMDILFVDEKVKLETLLGHGGLFKTPVVGQALMAAALNVPVAVMQTAGEGGPWGMALLAAYMVNKQGGETLEAYLAGKVFNNTEGVTVQPAQKDVEGFKKFIASYKKAVEVEKSAITNLN